MPHAYSFTDLIGERRSTRREPNAKNMRRLRNAYRHPFEYISPVLYRQNTEEKYLASKEIFVHSEEDFTRY